MKKLKVKLNEKELLSSFNIGNITLTPYLVIGDGTILEADINKLGPTMPK